MIRQGKTYESPINAVCCGNSINAIHGADSVNQRHEANQGYAGNAINNTESGMNTIHAERSRNQRHKTRRKRGGQEMRINTVRAKHVEKGVSRRAALTQ